jgi:hypothetical protein
MHTYVNYDVTCMYYIRIYVCIYIHMYIFIYTYIHAYIHIRIYVYTHTYTHTHAYTRITYIHIHTNTYVPRGKRLTLAAAGALAGVASGNVREAFAVSSNTVQRTE